MSWSSLLAIVVGWVLGIASHPIVNTIISAIEQRKFRSSLAVELRELGLRLAATCFKLESKYGSFDHDFVGWYAAKLRDYRGSSVSPEFRATVNKLEALGEPDLARWRALEQKKPDSVGLKKYSLPYLSAQMQMLSGSSSTVQTEVLQILAHVEMLNEEIDLSSSLFHRTFDSSLSPENYQVIVANQLSSYRNVSRMARALVDRIEAVVRQIS